MPQKSVTGQLQSRVQQVAQGAKQAVAAARRPWYLAIRWGFVLLGVDAVLLTLFGLLALWVHVHPVLPLDIAITREFQENQAPWLRYTMLAVSYPGSSLPVSIGLVVLAAVVFWVVHLRLEAVMVVALSAVSAVLNELLKVFVARPRPHAPLVEVIQGAHGQSFPSGHVMAYLAFWGFFCSLGIILFEGKRWWRMALLILPALLVVLVGPSRIYLGDHWASDVLGAYLIGGVLLGLALWLYLRLKQHGVLSTTGTGEKPV